MTEYWVSKQSYFCRYCDIYIRDDAPSRAQHENGLRHKGNLERYIRDIYKKEERLQKERADEAHQVSRINEAARLAHQERDLPVASSSKQLSPEAEEETEEIEGAERQKRVKYSKQDWKGAENLQNYSDARSLGLVDAEAEIEAAKVAEAERELRATEGRVGQWEAVTKLQPAQKQQPNPQSSSKIDQPKIVSKLSNDRDPDKKPIRKLFTERSLQDDSEEESLRQLEVKVKVDRRAQAQKTELDISASALHGSIQPIRLDGLQDHTDELDEKKEPSPTIPDAFQANSAEEQDIKPKTEELEASTPAEPTVLFKKRKLKGAKPRQKS